MAYPNGAKFTPPTAPTGPPFTPDTKGVQWRLARYRNPMAQGVAVFKLSDGNYCQSYPTPENKNTAVPPYPLSADNATETPNIINVNFGIPTPTPTMTVTTVSPYITIVYYGGHTYTVTSAEANALAGYTSNGSGYAADLVAI